MIAVGTGFADPQFADDAAVSQNIVHVASLLTLIVQTTSGGFLPCRGARSTANRTLMLRRSKILTRRRILRASV
jgi:hypothetical protein